MLLNQSSNHDRSLAFHAKSLALLQLKNWQQLRKITAEWLAEDPELPLAHYFAGWEAYGRNDLTLAALHARFMLEHAADQPFTHDFACRYWLSMRRPQYSLYHAQQMIEIDAENPWGYFFASVSGYSAKTSTTSKAYIDRARALDPDDADIARWQLRIDLARAQNADDIRRLEGGYFSLLRLDPEVASSHESLGDYYLFQLGEPRRAFACYRAALTLDPNKPDCQRKYFSSFQRTNLFYQTLFGHRTIDDWIHVSDYAPRRFWALVFLLPALPFFLLMIVLWLASAIVLFVPCLVTQLLFFPDELQTTETARSKIRGDFRHFPLWFRIAFLFIATALYWTWLAHWGPQTWHWDILILASIVALNFLMQLFMRLYQRGRLYGEHWIFLGVWLTICCGFAVVGYFSTTYRLELIAFGFIATIVISVVQGLVILFRWRRRRKHKNDVPFHARPAPLPRAT